jgi:hypothetical protein
MNINDPDLIIRDSGVGEIKNIDISSLNVSFIVLAGWTNSCGRLHHADIEKNASIYSIKVVGCQFKDDVCLEAMLPFEAEININVKLPGEYTFKFWRSESTTIDTTIFLK